MEFYPVNVFRKFYSSQHFYYDSYFNSLTLSVKFQKPRIKQKYYTALTLKEVDTVSNATFFLHRGRGQH